MARKPLYSVKVEYASYPASNQVYGRSRRDAAALLFERTLYAAIRGDAALDTARGWKAYNAGQAIVRLVESGEFSGYASVPIGDAVVSISTL